MKKIVITPANLKGVLSIPPSKSISHRALICAGLAEGESLIDNIIFSEDICATLEGMQSLGVKTEKVLNSVIGSPGSVKVKGSWPLHKAGEVIDCGESGSTLRFLIPLAGLTGEEIVFTGRGRLVERPLETYYKLFREQSIDFSNYAGHLPLKVRGLLKSGDYRIKGNISSQFITGLMFLLPQLEKDSRILITDKLESKGYVDLTIDVLKKYSVDIINNDYSEFIIKGNQKYLSTDYRVEGDFSQASFWIVAGGLGGNIECKDINISSLQGDRVIIDIAKKMGMNIIESGDSLIIKSSETRGVEIDASQCPDLVPVLAVLGALSSGTTRIFNAKRLKIKESDRLKAIATELNKLGADVQELADGLIIEGREKLRGGIVDSWNDHRIAMALAVASVKCTSPVVITNSSVVKKSYPHFWSDFEKLGGKVDERSMG
ncbi:MAG: 3-phosphoshikimate 1-carboxyvinyltransferase [Eubacteriales bacterium]